jgi:hypothetical protein
MVIALGIILGAIPDQALITVNTIELFGIIYLAIALSSLRERIAKSEAFIESIRTEIEAKRDDA